MSEAQFLNAYESGAQACIFSCDLQARADAPLGGRRISGRRSRREVLPRDPDLWLYRDRTLGLLRRYYRISIAAGRLPSLLGRELFRTRASAYRVATFEDAVIFVRDVERRLEQLDDFERGLLLKLVAEDHTQEEAGELLECGRRTIGRWLARALDCLTNVPGLRVVAAFAKLRNGRSRRVSRENRALQLTLSKQNRFSDRVAQSRERICYPDFR